MSGLYLQGTVPRGRVPNFNYIALVILELLAFNIQKCTLPAEEGMEVLYLRKILMVGYIVKHINVC